MYTNKGAGSGSSATAAEAGAAAAECAELRGLVKELKDQIVKPWERLKVGLKVFKVYEPPVLQNLAEEIELSSSLWQPEPALPFLCALGKYGPWQAKLRARARLGLPQRSPLQGCRTCRQELLDCWTY